MKYATLFTIEIEHDYFSVSKPQVLRIVPTTATKEILRGAGMVAKFLDNTLYVLIKQLDSSNPSLKVANDFKLQFFLEIVGFDFSTITNFETKDPYNNKLYFSNANSIVDGNDKSVENTLYLNEKLPIFDVTQEYFYNDIVRNGANTAFECLKKVNANSGNLNDTSQFRQLEKVSYISQATSLQFTGPEKEITVQTPSSEIIIKYFQYNIVSKQFDIEIKETVIGLSENPSGANIERVLLNFYNTDNKPFSEGIYRVTINAQEEFLYFRLENDWKPYLGLINIHNDHLAVSENYRFIKEDGTFYTVTPANTEIATRQYKIRFAPAQYMLKYVCRTNKVTNITDDDGVINFDNLGGNVFQSKLPVRMNEKAIDTISVAYNGSETLKKTKVPGYRNLSLSDDENKYLISETFLNL
ncbi:hypothetical protein M0D21_07345 [Aquimarina sp. D1M17]|uniref:hypothetical protein n=1 Tax=Aquimarina acroporae TaxID=2937283 RepID=UPI0020BEB9AE|nr:hypothetical protein [Aquimarina acroporae]MCK8521375.1 hypothetical protein [Aquimarina acroporae]